MSIVSLLGVALTPLTDRQQDAVQQSVHFRHTTIVRLSKISWMTLSRSQAIKAQQ